MKPFFRSLARAADAAVYAIGVLLASLFIGLAVVLTGYAVYRLFGPLAY